MLCARKLDLKMMDKKQTVEIINFLEHVRNNPQMYFVEPDDINEVSSFLLGFNVAYGITTKGSVPRFDSEGWEATYYKVPYPKPNKNVSNISAKDLVDQTLEVQINAWRKLLETTN